MRVDTHECIDLYTLKEIYCRGWQYYISCDDATKEIKRLNQIERKKSRFLKEVDNMITLILLIFIGLAIIGIKLEEELGIGLTIVSTLASLFCIILLFCNIFAIAKGGMIDQKIKIYQEENANIETVIHNEVKLHKKYNPEDDERIKETPPELLITTYPELQTSEYIRTQVSIYTENKNKIKGLREDKVKLPYRWRCICFWSPVVNESGEE
jgi:nitrogen fixation/metabolism regulation signal transduction histidine kinase